LRRQRLLVRGRQSFDFGAAKSTTVSSGTGPAASAGLLGAQGFSPEGRIDGGRRFQTVPERLG